jgi:hypothetical protein
MIKNKARKKNCGYKMALRGVRTYEYKALKVQILSIYRQSHNGNTPTIL